MGRVREMQTDTGRYIGRDVQDVGGNGRTVVRRRDNRVKEDERGMKFLFLIQAFITSGVYFGELWFPFAFLPLSLFLTSCKLIPLKSQTGCPAQRVLYYRGL